MSKFVIKDGSTKFKLMCGNMSFALHDYIYHEQDVLHINFDEETGIYNLNISNPSKSTKRALRDNQLSLGVSMCDITHYGYDYRGALEKPMTRRSMNQNRPYRISGVNEQKIFWKVSDSNRFPIYDLSDITLDINSITLPSGLFEQGYWVIRRIDDYGWPETTLKDYVTVDYKFVLMGLGGRAIKSYKTIYTAEIYNGRDRE